MQHMYITIQETTTKISLIQVVMDHLSRNNFINLCYNAHFKYVLYI